MGFTNRHSLHSLEISLFLNQGFIIVWEVSSIVAMVDQQINLPSAGQ